MPKPTQNTGEHGLSRMLLPVLTVLVVDYARIHEDHKQLNFFLSPTYMRYILVL